MLSVAPAFLNVNMRLVRISRSPETKALTSKHTRAHAHNELQMLPKTGPKKKRRSGRALAPPSSVLRVLERVAAVWRDVLLGKSHEPLFRLEHSALKVHSPGHFLVGLLPDDLSQMGLASSAVAHGAFFSGETLSLFVALIGSQTFCFVNTATFAPPNTHGAAKTTDGTLSTLEATPRATKRL